MSALHRIEIRIEAGGFAVVGVLRDQSCEMFGCFRSRVAARDHGLGKAEFFGTKLHDLTALPSNDTRVRVQTWSPR